MYVGISKTVTIIYKPSLDKYNGREDYLYLYNT